MEDLSAFPRWSPVRSLRWEGNLAWRGPLEWEVRLRGDGEKGASALFRVEWNAKLASFLRTELRLDSYQVRPGDAFRSLDGDRLDRFGRSLAGQGARLSGKLGLRKGKLSLRLDLDLAAHLPARLGLSLIWMER